MTAGIATLALLGSVALGSLERAEPSIAREVRAADEALESWDVAAAGAIAARLAATAPDLPETHLLAARVRFYEGRYAGALAALDAAERAAGARPDAAEETRRFREFVAPLAELDARFVHEESEHFRIHFVDGPDRVLVRRGLAALEACYETFGRDFGVRPREKVRVEIMPDPDVFQKASTLTRSEIETSGTIALCKFNRLMVLSPRNVLRGFGWIDTLCHEYLHYVLWKRNGPTVPIWLHEAIAKHEEVRWKGEAGSELTPHMKRVLKGAVEDGKFVSFDDMHPSFAKLDNPRDVALASAEVLSVLRTVMADGGYPKLNRMLDALAAGASWREMFDRALGVPFDAFWEAWRAGVAAELAGVEPAGPEGKLVELTGPGEPPAGGEDGAAPEADAAGRFARLGDLLRARDHHRAAAIEYRKQAEREERPSPVLWNRIGLALQAAGDPDEALEAFRRSETLDPDYAPTLTNLGLAERTRGAAAPAIEYLERAVAVNPYDPRLHAALADLYASLGRAAERDRAEAELRSLRDVPEPAASTDTQETVH